VHDVKILEQAHMAAINIQQQGTEEPMIEENQGSPSLQ
jgi:hypothetical protein